MRAADALALSILVATMGAGAQTVKLQRIKIEPAAVGANLLSNYGFEELEGSGFPKGWQFDKRNTDSTCVADSSTMHSGKIALKFAGTTPFGANIYGMLARTDPIRLELGKTYTLSAWVKSTDSNAVGLMTGGGWQFRAYVPNTEGTWRRIWTTFKPGESDLDCVVRFSVEAPTKGTWIDDIKLEEATEPTAVLPPNGEPGPVQLTAVSPLSEIQGEGAFSLARIIHEYRSYN